MQGVLLQMVIALQGATAVLLTREDLRPDHYTRYAIDNITVRLVEDAAWKGKRYRVLANIESASVDTLKWNVEGEVLLYFKDSIAASRLHCGDRLRANVFLQPLPDPKNPSDFNYKRFMERRQVYAKAVIKKYELLPAERIKVVDYAFECRRILLSQLGRYLHGQEYAVAAALLIGEDDQVDLALMHAFTATGTLHVLSVSGMHVGLIYMLLALLIGKLENKKGWRLLYFLILYLFLWAYAFVTGLSAPVVRSAMMLSLVLSGKLLERKSPVLNTLIGSFFLLMVINPFWLLETGFQLSYLAVFGIMTLHPLLLPQLDFTRLWMHRIWELVSVSLCAQLITVPIGLMYFGQFPNYFLISNLIIIPISTIAIYGGIATLVFSFVPYAGNVVAYLESWLLKILNAITQFLGELPGAVLHTGKISFTICIVLYLLLYFLVKWLSSRAAKDFISVLQIMILLSLLMILGL